MSNAHKEVVAIIPARGGSKGIPRKNLRVLAGKPLVAHSILQARETPGITRVAVSTDDAEIAAVSRQWGAAVVPRPAELGGDTASSESALLHALNWLRSSGALSADPELIVFLQATSPCRPPAAIRQAIDTLIRETADALLSVGPVHGFVWRIEKDGSPRSFSYDHLHRPRRQDAPEDLLENGSIYVFKPWVLRQLNNRLGGKIALYRMSALDSFQIDEPGDFELLEALMRYRSVSLSASDGERAGVRCDPPVSFHPSSLKHIKLLVLDFDGVMTDNRVLVTEDGKEAVFCSREDGLGIEMLRAAGKVEVLVISKEKNPVVSARCWKLGLECIQGSDNKLSIVKEKVKERPEQVAYVGNDVNDLECMRWVGMPIAVADASPEVKSVAKWVTSKMGGCGAIREVCDALVTVAPR